MKTYKQLKEALNNEQTEDLAEAVKFTGKKIGSVIKWSGNVTKTSEFDFGEVTSSAKDKAGSAPGIKVKYIMADKSGMILKEFPNQGAMKKVIKALG